MTSLVNEFQSNYAPNVYHNRLPGTCYHHELIGAAAEQPFTNADTVKKSIVKHCGGNPFVQKTELKNIVTHILYP